MRGSQVAQVAQTAPAATATRTPHAQRAWQYLLDHRWLMVTLAGALAVLLIFSRRPDALLNPQFDGEDGAYFYSQAYNLGPLQAFPLPVAGYLMLNGRIAALIALPFPLAWGPLIFNLLAIAAQAAPALFLLSRRFDHLAPSWPARLLIVFLYFAIPNSSELDASITYSQWHLALLAFQVVIAAPPSTRRWKVFDGAVVALTGLSGPFCLFLPPIIALRWLRTRAPALPWLLGIDLLTCAAQAVTLLTNIGSGRAHVALGANVVELARVLVGQVMLAATFSMRGYAIVSVSGWWASAWFPLLLLLVVGVYMGFALRHAPQELRLLWLYGALILAAALFSPVTGGPWTYWERLATPFVNLRYVFTLIVAWLVTLVWVVSARPAPLLRRVTLLLLAFTCLVAIPVDWVYPPFADYHYQAYVQRFEQLPPGGRLTTRLNPGNWTMTLIKR
ncbi:MAG TPA: hypothetical protein VFN78_14090 [Ktedonobacterales bacterium]|nr:hypothetical protein [Ktedonobacterales bacterium]